LQPVLDDLKVGSSSRFSTQGAALQSADYLAHMGAGQVENGAHPSVSCNIRA